MVQVPIVVHSLKNDQFGKAYNVTREYFFLLSERDFNHFDELAIETNEFSLVVNVVFISPTNDNFVENAELAVFFKHKCAFLLVGFLEARLTCCGTNNLKNNVFVLA